MIKQLDSENADRDLTSQVTCLTDTPDATNAMLCQALIYLGDGTKNLDGTGGDFEIEIMIGGQTVEPNPQLIAVSAGQTRAAIVSEAFTVPEATEVLIKVKSPNGADTDVDVTVFLYDAFPLNMASGIVESNLKQMDDVAQSAADLKDFADAGYDPATNSIEQCKVNDDMVGTAGANTTVPDAAGIAATLHGVTDGKVDVVDANVDAIKSKTDGLNFTGADVKATLDGEEVVTDSASRTASKADVSSLATAVALAVIDGNVDAILVDTDVTLPALIAALNNLSSAQAETACLAALAAKVIAELDGVTLDQAIAMIFGLGTNVPPTGAGTGSQVSKDHDGATIIGTKTYTKNANGAITVATFAKA